VNNLLDFQCWKLALNEPTRLDAQTVLTGVTPFLAILRNANSHFPIPSMLRLTLETTYLEYLYLARSRAPDPKDQLAYLVNSIDEASDALEPFRLDPRDALRQRNYITTESPHLRLAQTERWFLDVLKAKDWDRYVEGE